MRTVPPALQSHLNGSVITTGLLLQVTLENGEQYGITSHDTPITYEGLTYRIGFDPSVIASSSDLSVDNGEARSLFTALLSQNQLLNGHLDNATWKLYLINWQQPDEDNALLLDAGDIGEVKTKDDSEYRAELLSYAMRLKQNLGTSWSRACRATFGTPANGQTGCGASAPLVSGVVTDVDASDPFRVFQGDIDTGAYSIGRVVWTGGDNSGSRLHKIEAASPSTVALFEAMRFRIKIGDTFTIRKDCNKSPADCIQYKNFVNYKGEPFIPTGDGLESMTPSAQVFGGLSGSQIQP